MCNKDFLYFLQSDLVVILDFTSFFFEFSFDKSVRQYFCFISILKGGVSLTSDESFSGCKDLFWINKKPVIFLTHQ